MKGKRAGLILGISTFVLIILALAAETVYFSDFEYRFRTRRFNKILGQKEKVLDDCLNGVKPFLAQGESQRTGIENKLFSVAGKHHITIVEYVENKLVYWSDNMFDVPYILNDSLYTKPLIFIQNGWFLTQSVQAGNERVIGLLRLRTDYDYENDIIRNGFEKDFGIPGKTEFRIDKEASDFHVFKRDGTFLFSLIFPADKENTYLILIPLVLWICVFIMLLFNTLSIVIVLSGLGRNAIAVICCFLILAAFYLIVLLSGKPEVLNQTGLFSPYMYTLNKAIPSLGHLLILSILLSVFFYVFYKFFPLRQRAAETGTRNYLYLTLMLVPGALLILLYHIIFSHLILNSNINFETYKVLKINFFSISGFASQLLLFLGPVLYILKVFQSAGALGSKKVFSAIAISMVVLPAALWNEPVVSIPLALFYFITAAGLYILGKSESGTFNTTVILSLVFGFYSLLIITMLSEKKTTEKLKIQSVTLSTEIDPEAEYLLLDMWPEISQDSLLRNLMNVEYFERDDFETISDYLHEAYFGGYWANFNFNIYLCRRDDSLQIGQSGIAYEDCFVFFDDRIRKDGHLLTGTGFYFIDNQKGRPNYLGRLFVETEKDITNGIFIELYSDINLQQAGYSELLLDKKYHGYARLEEYSFAKYIDGEIVIRAGEFPFNKTDDEYVNRNSDYRIFNTGGFKHVLFRNGNVTAIISRPVLSAGNLIISFAYLFVFIFLFSNLIMLIIRRPVLERISSLNFRQKLQMSFIGILLFAFILIGMVITSFTIRQYQTKHYENIREKMNSIYLELDSKISMEKNLTSGWRSGSFSSLNDLLVRFSNIFNTDINLYDLNGYLIATSRPEIFYRNLTSRRMNNIAHTNLTHLTRSEYFQTEKIGSLEYISAYMPFYNNDSELLTYLNLPYFRLQSILTREISNLIVAVINFTLLLIVITMGLIVFISGRLTSPLTMLSSGLASVELGKKSEHLYYKGTDEIGELVKQYNRMVDELDDSAKKLANSEREYAWREMAKQIAHEIKNPLTPMKLNVQQLFKSWRDGVPGFEKKLEKFTRNQIEYINNLSSIATEFSAFAKIPANNPVEVDLVEQIKTTLELFKNSDNITLKVGRPQENKIFIYADKEHLNGVFSNLIKNGIQSIPPGEEGIIKVNVEIKDEKVIVSVSDNGTGIPESLQNKLFTPNFTTKSSGTGLGLSIVKRYVESANGRIWFESETDKGSVFYIEYPVLCIGEKQA